MSAFHLHNRFLNTLHPFPFHSRQAAEAFRDTLGCDDEIVPREVKALDDDEAEERELDNVLEDGMVKEDARYGQEWGE